MKRLAIFAILCALGASARAAATYPMEAGNLRRYNQALSLTNGAAPLELLWSVSSCGGGPPRSNPIVLADRVVQTFQTGLTCVSRFDGKFIWGVGSFGDLWSPAAYDPDRDLLYQSGGNLGAVIAIRPSDGSEAWHYYEGAAKGCFNMASCTYWQDKIYAGLANGRMVCLDADSHSVLWSRTIGAKTAIGTPALDGGQLFVGSLDGKLMCLDAMTGALVWQVITPKAAYASAVSLDDTRLFVMTTAGKVECHARSNGALLWSFQTSSWTLSNLSQGPLGLYASSDDRCMYRLDPSSGAKLWQTCFTGNFARSAPFCIGNTVLGSGCTASFYGVSAFTGAPEWDLPHGSWNSFTDFAEADGLIFVVNVAGTLFCFRPQNAPYPPTVTVSPTWSVSPTPSSTVTATPTPTASPSPSSTHTATSSATPSISPSSTHTATSSATPSISPSSTSTASPSSTFTASPSSSVTPSPSSTRTISQTSTASATPSLTPSVSPSSTISATRTQTPTATRTPQATSTLIPTIDIHGDGGKRDPGDGQCYVSPNPVRGGPCRLVYHMRAPGLVKVRLFQASGDPVGKVEERHDSAGVHSCEVSTQRYAPGVYFCRANLVYDQGGEDVLPLTKFIVLKAR